VFVVLERKTLTLRRDLSMSKDMRDWPRANLGVAANMLYPFENKMLHFGRENILEQQYPAYVATIQQFWECLQRNRAFSKCIQES
jgi:hypothetical protein